MIEAWRVVKKKYLKSAFGGEGARRVGGRWNSSGRPVVYLAESSALAILEMLVHVDLALLTHYVVIPVRFEDRMATLVDPANLPEGWRSHLGPSALKKIGDDWLKQSATLALRVPTVVAPTGWNYLLNPVHRNFSKVEIGDPIDFDMDGRLKALGRG